VCRLTRIGLALLQEFQVEGLFSHTANTVAKLDPPERQTAALDHWLRKLRDDGRGASKLDLDMLDEILPCVGGEGSG